MKKILICILLVLCLASCAFAAYEMPKIQNSPEGFRGLKWGDSAEKLPNKSLVEQDGDISQYYIRTDDKLSIGDANLETICYAFFQDKFRYVAIRFYGYENFDNLLRAFKAQFGTPKRPNRYLDKYTWMDSDVFIIVQYNDISEKGQAMISNTKLMLEHQKYLDDRAKAAQSDF